MGRILRSSVASLIIILVLAGCSAREQGNIRIFTDFPPSIPVPNQKPLLAFQGAVEFTWAWPGSLQGRAQDLVEQVGYFEWTNAPEVADYKLVVNLRHYPHVPSAGEWAEAVLTGLTLMLSPTFTQTDVYEMNAELLAPVRAAGTSKTSRRVGKHRVQGNYSVVMQLFFLFTPTRWYTRLGADDLRLIDAMLKDVIVWAHETIEAQS